MAYEISKTTKDEKVQSLERYYHQLQYDLMMVMEEMVNFNHVIDFETGQEYCLEVKNKYE